MKKVSPVPLKSPAQDETLQKLKSDIEVLITSGKSYVYKSPDQEFEEHLLRDFASQPEAAPKIKKWVADTKKKDPHAFTTGKHFQINVESLIVAKEYVREKLDDDRKLMEEEAKEERERQEVIKQEKAKKAKEKREAELKKKPWLKKENEKEKNPFDLGFGFSVNTSQAFSRNS